LPGTLRHAEPRAQFRKLARAAGALLPSELRAELAGYCPWHIADPMAWWVAVLWQLTGETVYVGQQCRDELGLDRPFFRSIEAIERLKLVAAVGERSEARRPKPRGGRRADYEAVRREAELVVAWNRARQSGVYKADFAKANGMKLADFDLLLDRVGKRKKRSDK
jgi:hypothetical protein